MTDALQDRFASLASAADDSDWKDVVARAGLARRRSTVAAVCVAFALGIAAASFVGIRLHSASAAVPGPKHVQRKTKLGTVHWLFSHQPRGESLAAAHIPLLSTVGSHWQPVKFARVVVPDPSLHAKVVVSLIGKRGHNVCMTVFLGGLNGGGGGCAVGLLLRPFTVMSMSGLDVAPAGSEFLAGMAGDDVKRIALYTQHRRWHHVALRNNVFVVALEPGEYPVNLVAYDAKGLVIGRSVWGAPRVGPLK